MLLCAIQWAKLQVNRGLAIRKTSDTDVTRRVIIELLGNEHIVIILLL